MVFSFSTTLVFTLVQKMMYCFEISTMNSWTKIWVPNISVACILKWKKIKVKLRSSLEGNKIETFVGISREWRCWLRLRTEFGWDILPFAGLLKKKMLQHMFLLNGPWKATLYFDLGSCPPYLGDVRREEACRPPSL